MGGKAGADSARRRKRTFTHNLFAASTLAKTVSRQSAALEMTVVSSGDARGRASGRNLR
jgi:hypothetical protein